MERSDRRARERRESGEGRELTRLRSAPTASRFAAGGRDGVTRVWSVAGGPPRRRAARPAGRVYDVGFGPTSDRVVSAGDDGTVRTWDAGRTQALDRAEPDLTTSTSTATAGSSRAAATTARCRVWDTARPVAGEPPAVASGYTRRQVLADDDTVVDHELTRRRCVRIWPVSANAAEVVVQPSEGPRHDRRRVRRDRRAHRVRR